MLLPHDNEDVHRAWSDTAPALQRICALHHRRQLGVQLSGQFEGRLLQVHPGQAHLPKGRAGIDIVEYGDARLELMYRGHVLSHTGHDRQDHLGRRRESDDKTLNDKVDHVVRNAQKGIAKLMAQIEHQNTHRAQGTYAPQAPANNPPYAGSARCELCPTQAEPT